MLLFSVPNKEMQERGKVFPWVKYFTQVGKLELQESISCNMKKWVSLLASLTWANTTVFETH